MVHPLLRFAYKNLLKSKSRTILAIMAVVLGVLLITALLVLTDSLVSSVDDSLGVLSGTIIVQEENSIDPSTSLINGSVVQKIDELNDTETPIKGMISSYAEEIWYTEKNNATEFGFSQVIGVVASHEKETVGVLNPENIVYGRTLEDNDVNATVIGLTTAIAMQVVPGNTLNISGFPLTVVGIFSTESFIDAFFYVPIETVRKFRTAFAGNVISTILLRPSNVDHERTIINYINENLSSIYHIEAGDIDELSEQGREFLELTTDFAFYIGIISIVIGSLSVFNAILMSVYERKKEIAVLKATGWKDSEVGLEVFLESILVGLIGGTIGLLSGVAVANYVTQQSNFLDISVNVLTLVKSFTYAVLLGIFAGLFPAFRAMRIDPVEDIVG